MVAAVDEARRKIPRLGMRMPCTLSTTAGDRLHCSLKGRRPPFLAATETTPTMPEIPTRTRTKPPSSRPTPPRPRPITPPRKKNPWWNPARPVREPTSPRPPTAPPINSTVPRRASSLFASTTPTPFSTTEIESKKTSSPSSTKWDTFSVSTPNPSRTFGTETRASRSRPATPSETFRIRRWSARGSLPDRAPRFRCRPRISPSFDPCGEGFAWRPS
mmetsp:Transcript_13829/g.27371  ORF Transcript_13829/g.27371 Transcript_13829/m.27371 type:complete len:217 (+) Transcript_13829:191-841(+)